MKRSIDKVQSAYLQINPRKCGACWKCVKVCPKQVIAKVGCLWHRHIILENSDNCIGCKNCIKVCRHGVFSEIQKIPLWLLFI